MRFRFDLTIFQKGLILVGVPLLLELFILSSMFMTLNQIDQERVAEGRQRQLSAMGTQLLILSYDAGQCCIHGNPRPGDKMWRRYEKVVDQINELLTGIVKLCTPEQSSLLRKYLELETRYLGCLEKIAEAKRGGISVEFVLVFREQLGVFNLFADGLGTAIAEFLEPSERYMALSQVRQQELMRRQWIILGIGISLSIAAAAGLSRFFSRNISRRLSTIIDNTHRLARQQMLHPPVDGADEIASLDKSFHEMSSALTIAVARERALFEKASEVICVLNRQWRFTRINPACLRQWGYAPDELLGAEMMPYVLGEDVAATRACFAEAQRAKEALEFENRIRRQDGSVMHVLWSIYWSETEQSLFCIAHDVSEKKRLERLRQEFLSMVSHDLRSPLASIVGSFELMIAGAFGALPDQVRKQLTICDGNGSRLLALINDLLDLEKLEAGQLAMTTELISAEKLLYDCLSGVERTIDLSCVHVDTVCAPGLTILADRDRLAQCLTTLISSAIRFSPRDSELAIVIFEQDGLTHINLTGQGPGIPSEVADTLFERFRKEHGGGEKEPSGIYASGAAAGSVASRTQLDLPVCKRIIQAHGGAIGVRSTSGAGFTFWVTLPRTKTQAQTETLPKSGSGFPIIRQAELARSDASLPPVRQSDSEASSAGSVALLAALSGTRAAIGAPAAAIRPDAEPAQARLQAAAAPLSVSDLSLSFETPIVPVEAIPGEAATLLNASMAVGVPIVPTRRPALSDQLNNLSLSVKGIIMVTIPVVFEFIFVLLLGLLIVQADGERNRELQQRAIANTASSLITCVYESVLVMSLNQNWKRFDKAVSAIPPLMDRLHDLTKDDPSVQDAVHRIDRVFDFLDEFYQKAYIIAKAGDYSTYAVDRAFAGHERLMAAGVAMTPAMQALVDEARHRETESPTRLAELRKRQGYILLAGLVFNVGTSLALALFFAASITRRLDVLADNARRLSEDRPLNPSMTGRDEIAHLDRVFHGMAAALAQARHKQLVVFDNSQDVICSWDDQWLVSSINPACYRMWGYEPTALRNQRLLDFIPPDCLPAMQAALDSARQQQDAVYVESRIVRKDRSESDVAWSIAWSPNEERFFSLGHDITKSKELERLRAEFLSIVSEDLHRPLAAIVDKVRQLEAGNFGQLSEKAMGQMPVVLRSAERLLKLIDDLLDSENLQSGVIQLHKTPCRASSLLEQSMAALTAFSQQRQVELVNEPCDIALVCDGDRIVQVLVNLMSNAIKFSPAGAQVNVRVDRQGNDVRFAVIDQGRGVPEAHRQIIFEKFTQVEAADSKRSAGTGLGLPICKQLVEAHGGRIACTANPGAGSIFWFTLPTGEVEAT